MQPSGADSWFVLEVLFLEFCNSIASTDAKCIKSQQVVYGHLDDPHHQEIIRGKSYLQLRPGTEKWLLARC